MVVGLWKKVGLWCECVFPVPGFFLVFLRACIRGYDVIKWFSSFRHFKQRKIGKRELEATKNFKEKQTR